MTFDEMLEDAILATIDDEIAFSECATIVYRRKQAIAKILAEALIMDTPPPRFRMDLLVRPKGE